MASILVDKWPENKEEIYDYKQWVPKEWITGEPITKEKLQNLDDGIAVLATQVNAILGEFKPSSLDNVQLNASRLDNIQKWITGSTDGFYDIGGSGGDIVSRLDTQNDNIEEIRGWIAGGSGYQNDYDIDSRLGMVESSIGTIESENNEQDDRLDNIDTLNDTQNNRIENLENRAENIEDTIDDQGNRLITIENELVVGGLKSRLDVIENWITDSSTGIVDRLQLLEDSQATDETNITTLQNDNNTNKTNINNIITEIYGSNDTSIVSRLDDLETEICGDTITRTSDGTGYDNSRIDNLENKVGNGVGISPYTNLTEAVINIMGIEGFDRVSIFRQNVNNILAEIWGEGKTLDNVNFIEDVSRIDELDNTINNENGLSKQVQTLATNQNTLEQNLAAINAKIPIEMYVAKNSSASDTIELDAVPRDKSVFFVAIPLGTLGEENLKLQTSDIQFVDNVGQINYVTLKKNYADPIKVKYPQNSIISIYRKNEKDSNNNITSSNAYIVNVPMVL